MPPRGRPPKPASLKLLDGNPGKRAIKPDVKLKPGKPTRPRNLSQPARREWDRLLKLLPESLLEQVDVHHLTMLVEAIVTHRRATEAVEEHGLLVDGLHGLVANPAVAIQTKSAALVQRLGADLGLSPVARARLTIPETPDEDLAALLTPANRRSGGAA